MTTLIRRHPLRAFFALAYVFSWWPVPFGAFLPLGPLLAAVTVIACVDGREGLRGLWRRQWNWRVRPRWYAVAIGIPAAVIAATVIANIGLGASASALGGLDPWYLLLLAFAVRLVNPLDGPLGEEPGWRGFALPHLQRDRSPLHASAILALLVAGWHIPLLFLPGEHLAPILLVATVAVTFVYTWIFNRTARNPLMTLVAHAAEGTITLGALGFVGADQTRVTLLYAGAWCVVALGLLVFDWRFWRGTASGARRIAVGPPPRPAAASPARRRRRRAATRAGGSNRGGARADAAR